MQIRCSPTFLSSSCNCSIYQSIPIYLLLIVSYCWKILNCVGFHYVCSIPFLSIVTFFKTFSSAEVIISTPKTIHFRTRGWPFNWSMNKLNFSLYFDWSVAHTGWNSTKTWDNVSPQNEQMEKLCLFHPAIPVTQQLDDACKITMLFVIERRIIRMQNVPILPNWNVVLPENTETRDLGWYFILRVTCFIFLWVRDQKDQY